MGFNQVGHIRIPIVIVPGVLLVEEGHSGYFIRSPNIGVIPIREHVHAVRVGKNEDEDDVIQDPESFRVRRRDKVIGQLEVVLGRCAFRGMEPAIDIDNGPSLGGLFLGFGGRESGQ